MEQLFNFDIQKISNLSKKEKQERQNNLKAFLVPISTATFPATVVIAKNSSSLKCAKAMSIATASSVPGSVSIINFI